METNTILQGDALAKLKELPDESIDMVMTSPPYWALRDYGIEGQLGLEKTFEEYINKLCDIFDETKRVLKDTGTIWVNLGDTYSGSGAGTWKNPPEEIDSKEVYQLPYNSNKKRNGILPSKCLTMIPMRFAIEMVNRGWILRNTIIWHKPNCMPCSVKDRFTVDFEYLFFFSKKKKYYFETQYEEMLTKEKRPMDVVRNREYNYDSKENNNPKAYLKQDALGKNTYTGFNKRYVPPEKGRNKRTVWSICPKPFSEAHFAVYPEELCETPIKAGCPEEGIVLDMFFGAGTTGLVALKQGKKFIGIELSPDYIEIAKKRLKPYLEQTKLK